MTHIWRPIIGACLCLGLLSGCTLSMPSLFNLWPAGSKKSGEDKLVKDGEQIRTDSRSEEQPPEGPGIRLPNRSDYVTMSPYCPIDLPPRDPWIRDRKLGQAIFRELRVPPDVRRVEPPKPEDSLPTLKRIEPVKGPAPEPAPLPPQPIVAALTCLLQTPPAYEEAITHLKTYDSITQDFFLSTLPVLAELTRKGVEKMDPKEIAALQHQVQALLLTLRARSDLVIDKMCFVQKIEGPGAYHELPEKHPFLRPCGGRPAEQVLIYVELHNVGSLRVSNGYETRLSSRVEIFAGDPNSTKPEYTYNLASQSRPLRSPESSGECFRGYTFFVPDILPGNYTLRITVTDETTSPPRHARAQREFRVAPGDVATN